MITVTIVLAHDKNSKYRKGKKKNVIMVRTEIVTNQIESKW